MVDAPILEFDPNPNAILEPRLRWCDGQAPEKAVLCFFQEVLQSLLETGRSKVAHTLISEIGPNPIYTMEWEGQTLALVHPGVGAPLSAGYLDELISMGMRQFVVCGGCGVLVHEIAAGHVVLVREAIRDEGTSYHYLPPARSVPASAEVTATIAAVLERHEVPFVTAMSWTTDGIYRETEGKRAARIAEGCSVVEMEAAALFAVAKFRGARIGQLVYGGDLVVPEGWDKRDWNKRMDNRSAVFWWAVESCAALPSYNRV